MNVSIWDKTDLSNVNFSVWHETDMPILNDLAASFEGRNEYISRLCRYPLLILDDFGMERGTEYGLEQVSM